MQHSTAHGLVQVGIELSDEEGDADPFEDDLAVRGKGGRKTGGRQGGTADAAASAKQLQQVLQPALRQFMHAATHHAYIMSAAAACVEAYNVLLT